MHTIYFLVVFRVMWIFVSSGQIFSDCSMFIAADSLETLTVLDIIRG